MAQMIYRAIRYCAAYVDNGAQAYEKRMRKRTLRTDRNLIKSHSLGELELKTAFAPVWL